MFATDRDLLILEPNLFRDAAWVGQRLLFATGSVSGSTLTISGADFAAQGIDTGNVLLYDATPLEITARLSATQVTVSLIRPDPDGPIIPPPALGSRPIAVATFAPQTALIHSQLLRMLGIEPGAPASPNTVTESSITNPRSLALVESLGALHLIYTAAAALSGPASVLGARADQYRRRFSEERRLAAAAIDLNGDGLPDATRRFNMFQLMRA